MLGVVAALPLSMFAKAATIAITISGGDLAAPVRIVDPLAMQQYSLWAGAGTFSSFAGGPEVEGATGFRYEVGFEVATNPARRYTVIYERDVSRGEGYVYLPGRGDNHYIDNATLISRGRFDGHWLHATPAWVRTAARFIPSP